MERQRVLTKVIDFSKLHGEFAAQSATFTGLAGDATIGGTLRIINPDDLTDVQIDATILAHVPPTPAQIADAQALTDQAQKAIKATVVWTLRRLLGRAPTAAEITTARDEWIAVWKILP